MSTQLITSKNTSVNTTKLPAIYNAIKWNKLQECVRPLIVFDYGCGRKTDHIKEFLAKKDIQYIGYDPYWTSLKLEEFLDLIKESATIFKRAPVIICSNVLNVLPEWDLVWGVKRDITNCNKIYFIKVYEGDKSGVGKMTKDDCWQMNQPTRYYTSRFETVYKGIITCSLYTRFL